eukprot:3211213-Pleurochrysis_carterae.AAC.1
MHATPMPRTTRVTRTEYGNGARPHRPWSRRMHRTRPCAVVCPHRFLRAAPLSTHCIGRSGQPAGERARRQRCAQRVVP